MQRRVSYKVYLVLFILTLIYVVFAIRYSPIFERLGSDKEVFQYMGMLIKNQQYPYTDAFDHKPPIIYLLNYLGVLLTPNSTWGVFLILNSFGLFCSMLIYKLAFTKLKEYLAPLLIAVLFVIIINSNDILQESNITRQFAAYLTIIILFVVFNAKKTFLKCGLLGFLIGIIFFTQQNEILGGLVMSGYFLLFKDKFQFYTFKRIVKNTSFFVIGLSAPFTIILLIINHWNNYEDFLNQVFLFNFNNYIDNKAFITKIGDVVLKLAKIIYVNKVLLVSALLILFNLLFIIKNKRHKNSGLTVLFIALAFQALSSSISGRAYGHYFFMFIPYMIFIFIFSWNENKFKYKKHISIILIGVFAFQTIKLLPYEKPDNSLLEVLTKEVFSVEGEKGQFYSLNGRYLRVNFNLNIVSPSKHIYAHFMNEKVAKDIIKDLNVNQTKYVLYDEGDANIIPSSLKEFLTLKYEEVLRYQNHILYKKE